MGKFCSNCGKEDNSNSNYCQSCGSALTENVEAGVVATNGMALAGFILSFFVPVLGLIFSIIGVNKAKSLNGNRRGLAIAGIIISAVGIVLQFISIIVYSAALADLSTYYY